MIDVWSRRLRRAEQLERNWPFAREVLSFYRKIASFQSDVAAAHPCELKDLLPFVRPLLDTISRSAPGALAALAEQSRKTSHEDWLRLLAAESSRSGQNLLALLLLQPYVMNLPGSFITVGDCPKCSHLPIVSVLREDKQAEAVRRSLVCSLCSAEWIFTRVLCPGCLEERPEKLPRFTADEIPWIRVEACDSCKKYLKAIDITKNLDAEPVVDELASTPLDIIAHDRGYEKITPNLIGV